jgi:hypothetical protein
VTTVTSQRHVLDLAGSTATIDLSSGHWPAPVTVLVPRTRTTAERRCGPRPGVVTDTWPPDAHPDDPMPVIRVWFEPDAEEDTGTCSWADRVLRAAHRCLGRGEGRTTTLPAGQFDRLATFDPATGSFAFTAADPSGLLARCLGRPATSMDIATTEPEWAAAGIVSGYRPTSPGPFAGARVRT